MSIKPLNDHYSMTAAPSVVDEEAMTALELASRCVGKTNECVKYLNENVDKLPDEVKTAVNAHITNGEFDKAIDAYIGYLQQRITTLENNYTPGSTTADAALYDLNVDAGGQSHATPGEAVRANQINEVGVLSTGDLNTLLTPNKRYIVTGGDNRPVTTSGLLEIKAFKSYAGAANPWVVQTWFSINSLTSFARVYNPTSGIWQDWVKTYARFDKPNLKYITVGLNDTITNMYGIVAASTAYTPEAEAALFESQQFASTDKDTFWTRQTWTGIDSGRIYERIRKPDGTWTPWKRISAHENISDHILKGKRVIFLGDSIFGNNQTSTGVVNRFADITGAECYNFAFGGTSASVRGGTLTTWAKMDGVNLVNAIVTSNFTEQENAVETATDFPGYFADSLSALKAFDFSTADYIIMNWGTNDWTRGETQTTYLTALTTIVELLSTAYPNAIIIRVKPTQRFFNVDGIIVDGNTHAWNRGDGVTLKSFIEKDNTLTDTYNIQVIDTYNIGINKLNYSHYFTGSDLTHHNENGRERLARFLSKHIV